MLPQFYLFSNISYLRVRGVKFFGTAIIVNVKDSEVKIFANKELIGELNIPRCEISLSPQNQEPLMISWSPGSPTVSTCIHLQPKLDEKSKILQSQYYEDWTFEEVYGKMLDQVSSS